MRAVAHVAQALECVAPERALQDIAAFGAVKQSSPLLELANAVWRFLRVNLRHAPVVEELSSAHGIAEMRAPVVAFVHIGHRGGNSTFGHNRVCLAKKRFADHADARSVSQGFNRSAQTRTARANNQDVVFVGFKSRVHSSRMSLIAPDDARRM